MNFSKFYEQVSTEFSERGKLSSETIIDILTDYEVVVERNRVRGLLGRYDHERSAVPVLTRQYKIDNVVQDKKINNKINVPFFTKLTQFL